jgi:hypothetical protein
VLLGAGGQLVENQGTSFFDADGDGENDTTRGTDDPEVGGTQDPTVFTAALIIPPLGDAGITVLAVLIAVFALQLEPPVLDATM